ncbi:MAG: hypothetical protein IID46_04990, partial [Planctomycetes bacterium]|nr:hypothetical protein [Planctomycetota bacterium]
MFGFAFEPNSANALTQNIRPNAQLLVNGTVVMDGFAKIIKSVIKNKSNSHQYEFRILGDNGVWKQQLEENNLRDLDYSEFDHAWTKANITDSEFTIDADPNLLKRPDIVYPLINYGMEQDSPHVNSNDLNKHEVRVEDRYPSFQVKSLVERMFKATGFKITSTFFESDFFKRLYIPFTREEFRASKEAVNVQLYRSGITSGTQEFTTPVPFPQFTSLQGDTVEFDDETTGGLFDNGGNFNTTTHQYIVPGTGIQRFVFEVSMQTLTQDFVFFSAYIMKNRVQGLQFGDTLVSQAGSIEIAEGVKKITIDTGFIEVVA